MVRFELERILGNKKAEAAFLATSCAVALVYRGWGLFSTIASGIPNVSYISYDGVYYAQIARNILYGSGPGWEALVFPVLQPILVAMVSLATGIDNLPIIAHYINLIAGVALLVPAYYLAREYFGTVAAAATVLILLTYPHLVAISGGDTAESLYSFLVFLSLLAAYRAIDRMSRPYMFLAGLSLGATYLARPEGLNIFCMFFAIAAWCTLKSMRPADAAKRLGLAAAGFAVLALPYVAFLTSGYGRLILSSKLPYESVVMRFKVYKEPLDMRAVDGLSENGELIWREKGGAGVVLGYFREDPARFVRTYLANLASELPWKVRNSTHLQGYPVVYPLYFWLPAILGFWVLARNPSSRWKALLIYTPFVNMFVYPVFTAGFWVYHVPYVAGLVILAVGGYGHVCRKLKLTAGTTAAIFLAASVLWAGYSAYVRLTSDPMRVGIMEYRSLLSKEAMKAGERARKCVTDRPVYMMGWSRLVYYLGGRWLCIPATNPTRVVQYGVKHGADYLVEELEGEDLLRGSRFSKTAGLSLVYEYRSKVAPYAVLVWRIERRADVNG